MRFLLDYKFLYIVSLCLFTDLVGFKNMEVTGCLMGIIAIGCAWFLGLDILEAEEHKIEQKKIGCDI